jgi:tryptophan synthase alpha subunit
VEGLISSLREATDKAICVGFGVSGPEQVRAQASRQRRQW